MKVSDQLIFIFFFYSILPLSQFSYHKVKTEIMNYDFYDFSVDI